MVDSLIDDRSSIASGFYNKKFNICLLNAPGLKKSKCVLNVFHRSAQLKELLEM